MAYQTLTLEHDGPIAWVWLNRPARLNALNTTALEEIAAVFTELQRAYTTPVVVFAGRGRAFCAGADRKDPPSRIVRDGDVSARERRHAAQVGRRALMAIEACEAITVACLHGHVVGGGLALALACDLRLAAAGTQFHIPEVDLGIPLGWGATPRLAREIGMARAKELILLCDRFDADTARQYGVINRVVADAELESAVRDWAARLAAKPAWALHMAKTQFRAYAQAVPLGDVSEMDGDLILGAATEDPMRFLFPDRKS